MMGSGEEKEINMIFSAFTTHHSILPPFPGPDLVCNA